MVSEGTLVGRDSGSWARALCSQSQGLSSARPASRLCSGEPSLGHSLTSPQIGRTWGECFLVQWVRGHQARLLSQMGARCQTAPLTHTCTHVSTPQTPAHDLTEASSTQGGT